MYTYAWKKYLPVIRLLLKRSAATEQQMSLDRIDFENKKKFRKSAFSFAIELRRAKLTSTNPPQPARDLVEILLQDETCKTLLRESHYAISLNSDFMLKIHKVEEPVTEQIDEDSATANG